MSLHATKYKVLPKFIEIRWLSLHKTLHRAVHLKYYIIEFYKIKNQSNGLLNINEQDKLNENEWIDLESILPFIEKISNVAKVIESDSNEIFFNALDLIMTILQDIPLEMINNGFTYQAGLLKNALKKILIKYQNYLRNLTIVFSNFQIIQPILTFYNIKIIDKFRI